MFFQGVNRSSRVGAALLSVFIASGTMFAGTMTAEARGRSSRNAFTLLEGSWAGVGAVTSSNGQKENVRCRATYSLAGENNLTQNLVCASASFRFNVSSSFVNQDGKVSGQWSETSRGVGGAVSGTVEGGTIKSQVTGQGFTASFIVNVGSRTHNVTIVPQGADIAAVQISFNRV